MQEKQYAIYQNVLENITDAVITIDSQGIILLVNAAAIRLLHLPNGIIGKSFAEIFLFCEQNDEFNDIFVDAIYNENISRHKEINYLVDGKTKCFIVNTTFLNKVINGKQEKIGVIGVLSDITERKKAARVKKLFGKYVDPLAVEALLLQNDDELAKGRHSETSILFADMQNSTKIGEQLSADELVALMNCFLDTMSQPIHNNRGVLDKYIGDEVMAFWGEPFVDVSQTANLACLSGLEQLNSLTVVNDWVNKRINNKKVIIDIRIGIATGATILGNMGSKKHKNYTVMGDSVNFAARLIKANKEYGTRMLIGDNTAKKLDESFILREIDYIRVCGKREIKTIFEVMGKRQDEQSARWQSLADIFTQGLTAYREQRWQDAEELFMVCLQQVPTDTPSQLFLARVAQLKKRKLPVGWTGIYTQGS